MRCPLLVNCKSIRTPNNPNPRLGANDPPIISAKPRIRVVGCPDTFATDEYVSGARNMVVPGQEDEVARAKVIIEGAEGAQTKKDRKAFCEEVATK